jgi:predicted HTH domain antitoxin
LEPAELAEDGAGGVAKSGSGAAAGPGLAAAVKLLELGRLSTGAAARLAGLPVPVFLGRLADYGVATFRMTEAEIRQDAQRA